MTKPTTTSYAILCLLAVRPWTTYELARQMERSVGAMWPRAESVVYDEPKRLVTLGLADSRTEHTGNRRSTVYSITPEGRRALHAWLDEPGAPPRTEFEGLLKVAFADHGSLDGLRANIAAIGQHALSEVAQSEERAREYAETGGPFPDRLPIIALAQRWFAEQASALARWAAWAEAATADWSGVSPDEGAITPPDAFGTDSTPDPGPHTSVTSHTPP